MGWSSSIPIPQPALPSKGDPTFPPQPTGNERSQPAPPKHNSLASPTPPHSALPGVEQQIPNSAPPAWIEDPPGSDPAPAPSIPSCSPLTGVGWRAELAGVAPGTAQGAAAGGPGDPHADLSAAGDAPIPSVLRVQEAIPNAGICTDTGLLSKETSPGELGGAGGVGSWNSGVVWDGGDLKGDPTPHPAKEWEIFQGLGKFRGYWGPVLAAVWDHGIQNGLG